MLPLIIPLYYQLLEAYHPQSFLPPPPAITQIIQTPTPTPTPNGSVLGVTTNPAIGGEGQVISIALLGDSMIDTLPQNIILNSLNSRFPTVKFNLYDYGYGSTNIESALSRLTQKTTYLSSENPPIVDIKPNILVIESFAYNNFGNSPDGLDRQLQNLQKIIATVRQLSPDTKIVLAATIAPNSLNFGRGIKDIKFSPLERAEKTSTIKLYLQNLISYAKSQNLPLINAYQASLDQNSEGLSELINNSDHLHPSDLGAELFADLLAQTISANSLL